jgi:hypothetical protein
VSCCGLEEFTQLCKRFDKAAKTVLGDKWREAPELQALLALPPGKRYSRLHLPEVRIFVVSGVAVHPAGVCIACVMPAPNCGTLHSLLQDEAS